MGKIAFHSQALLFGRGEHSGTKAHPALVALQNIVIRAGFATIPERRVLGEFRKRYGLVAEGRIDFHDGQACGNPKTRAEG